MVHHADYASFTASESKEDQLQQLVDSYDALASSQTNWVANLANCASLLWHLYANNHVNVNWAGFYVKESNSSLVLGPFMGKVACQTIAFGRGVCGNAASSAKTQLVPNVNEYPGHIACDGETQSEIVVPVIQNGSVVAVIDIDCLDLNGFDHTDVKYLEILAKHIADTCVFDAVHTSANSMDS